ncbi:MULTISPECIES: protoheme IX biogenesis protein HemY [Tatumella]|uniref:Protoheme IX biogenesis protein HemY n=1 Tax=Tatumella punctata TaxID=399969 RepID=A0ABW1VSZ4_9GAMM|nr:MULTISPECIES: protoheme IX biogenesis protein HemY [unclassified Tatumella]MBS0857178.1 protoheme IX biogenesis protein HemY [Tatumella sp. JGM16]MBS0878545.1 protoheme IX biogenesis protein HemY [Tatumella sp. JGM82]MBS0892137.1 protoheme IX biogenesis protein HemY [Tatumella sp. JGM94]MBS0903236.1 protoheme IX biogenesis protein HemY [Tatumella sp. JGM100]MBS0913931.1 protoheme IX biogenesis protein HemY [Tatumella sp. JGM91]
MLKVLILFLLLLAGVILGPLLAGHQGYVLIQTDNWNIETSVTGLAIILILALVVILAVEWLLRRILRTGVRTRGWFSGRKRRRAQRHTRDALIKLAEGDHRQVEKLLSRDADHAADPLANYLLAAEAAQQRGDEIRANQHLERAAEVCADNQIPVEITRARILLARHEDHAARHCLDRLLEVAPRHPEVLRLAEQAYLNTGAWRALLDILPSMEKSQVTTEQHLQDLRQRAWLGMMNQAMAEQGSEGLKQWWKNQSRKTRQDTALQVAMVNHLIECNDPQMAQEIVLAGLKQQYDERLILLLPRINSPAPEQLEKVLRQQIRQHGATPLLNSTLGQMLMRQAEWQQAADVFLKALEQRPDTFDYAWLADCYDKTGRPEQAAKMRREGLLLTLRQNPDQ